MLSISSISKENINSMKRLFIIAFAVVAIALVNTDKVEGAYSDGSALGLGAGVSFSGKDTANFGNFHLTGKISGSSVMFGLDIGFGTEITGVDLSFDWWLFNPTFGDVGAATLSMYLGPGLDVGIGFGGTGEDNPFTIALGGRVPLGLSWCIGGFEIFTEFVFAMHVLDIGLGDGGYVKLFGVDLDDKEDVNFVGTLNGGFNFGFRYWF